MGIVHELRARVRHVVWPVVGIGVIVYFAYHVVHGERGLPAWRSLQQQIAVAEADLAALEDERRRWENRVRLLHPGSLDPDMLDEWSRRMLNFGHPDELVIFDPPADSAVASPPATGSPTADPPAEEEVR